VRWLCFLAGMNDAIRTGTGLLHGIPVALAVMEFGFMGGSMGSVVGEKLTRLIEYATQEGLTLLVVCTSGGARMQVRCGLSVSCFVACCKRGF
jgi:acetyl-CoA carboxylase carboxyl transferase subunit beta